jgi:transcriptional regulator with XRE-family HTH domain
MGSYGKIEEKENPMAVSLPYLKAWRQYKLMSQTELRDRSGVTVSSISVLENGKSQANTRTVGKLAEALGITREQLVRERPPES